MVHINSSNFRYRESVVLIFPKTALLSYWEIALEPITYNKSYEQ